MESEEKGTRMSAEEFTFREAKGLGNLRYSVRRTIYDLMEAYAAHVAGQDTDVQRDYADMRRFQAKFMEADHALQESRAVNQKMLEALKQAIAEVSLDCVPSLSTLRMMEAAISQAEPKPYWFCGEVHTLECARPQKPPVGESAAGGQRASLEQLARDVTDAIGRDSESYVEALQIIQSWAKDAGQGEWIAVSEIVAEMRGEVSSKTMPIVHDAATAHWADRLDAILKSLPSPPASAA